MQNHLKEFKIGVFISGGGSNLQALIDGEKSGSFHSAIAGVVSSNNEAYGVVRAKKEGIPVLVSNDEDEVIEFLNDNAIDLIVLAGYLRIISPKIMDKYSNRIINIHPSLLPKYGGRGMYGLNVHRAVFSNRDIVSGATVHYVNQIVDGGEILIQAKVSTEDCKSPEEIQAKVLEIEHSLLVKAVKILEEA